MKLEVDLSVCVGHGRCYALAPDLFGEDDRGFCLLLHETVPKELEDQARRGEQNCPEGAITLRQD
jgi:ferredoxin